MREDQEAKQEANHNKKETSLTTKAVAALVAAGAITWAIAGREIKQKAVVMADPRDASAEADAMATELKLSGKQEQIFEHNIEQLHKGLMEHLDFKHPGAEFLSERPTSLTIIEQLVEAMDKNPEYLQDFVAEEQSAKALVSENKGLDLLLKEEFGIEAPLTDYAPSSGDAKRSLERINQGEDLPIETTIPLFEQFQVGKPQDLEALREQQAAENALKR